MYNGRVTNHLETLSNGTTMCIQVITDKHILYNRLASNLNDRNI
jgi:hypothetical protein